MALILADTASLFQYPSLLSISTYCKNDMLPTQPAAFLSRKNKSSSWKPLPIKVLAYKD
jgi:hypothetical protein